MAECGPRYPKEAPLWSKLAPMFLLVFQPSCRLMSNTSSTSGAAKANTSRQGSPMAAAEISTSKTKDRRARTKAATFEAVIKKVFICHNNIKKRLLHDKKTLDNAKTCYIMSIKLTKETATWKITNIFITK